jgi:acyl-CoA synthetase (AMP-forming)/AMP-acid ligase II
MTIIQYLEHNADIYSNEISIIERKYSASSEVINRKYLTWLEFNTMSNQVANFLLSSKIRRGDKVAILMANNIEWLPIYFGILKSGAIAVPLNYRFDFDELYHCLTLAECSAMFFTSNYKDIITEIYDNVQHELLYICISENKPDFSESYDTILASTYNKPPDVLISDDDFAAIYFTSGTTGLPKAVLHTHGALNAVAEAEINHHKQIHNDVFVCIPPLYHTGAKMHWFGNLISGSTTILLCNMSPRWILETISQEKATIIWLLLPWAQDILEAIKCGDLTLNNYDISNWRLTHMGAQPIPSSLIQEWKKAFPLQLYDTNYGLSEAAGPGCIHLGVENEHKIGSIGIAGYKWEANIFDDHYTPVQKGSIGELAVKGRGVMVEYYKDPISTAAVLHNDWLLTGDLAYMDGDGFIFLVGRKKDLIISGGENIYPVQVENFLVKHPSIKDVAVIGLPDKWLGEMLIAVVELNNGVNCSKGDLKRYCIALPAYKRPTNFYFMNIPRNATGKIEKERLKEQVCKMKKIQLNQMEVRA